MHNFVSQSTCLSMQTQFLCKCKASYILMLDFLKYPIMLQYCSDRRSTFFTSFPDIVNGNALFDL